MSAVASAPRGVRTTDAGYSAAVAELPLRSRAARDSVGSIVVIGGADGWPERVRRAVDDGAAAVVLDDPTVSAPRGAAPEEPAPSEPGQPLAPVIVARPRLRADVAADASTEGMGIRLVQVECGGSATTLPSVLRDAIGWGRVLAGGVLVLVASRASSRGLTVLLEREARVAGDPPLTVTVLASRREEPLPWIRALAIAGERVEVTVDDATGAAVVRRSTMAGQLELPTRWESAPRVALRRALDAVEAAAVTTDLRELDHDSALSAQALGVRRSE